MFWSKKCSKEVATDSLIEKLTKTIADPISRNKAQIWGRWKTDHELCGFAFSTADGKQDVIIRSDGNLQFRKTLDTVTNSPTNETASTRATSTSEASYAELFMALTQSQKDQVKELFNFILVCQATAVVDTVVPKNGQVGFGSLRADVSD